MALKYTRARGTGFPDGSEFRNLASSLQKYYEAAMEEVGKDAVDEAREFISNAGTGNSWTEGWPGGKRGSFPGREDSGAMSGDIAFRVIRGKGIGLDVGWINNFEEYYGAQEKGFSAGGWRAEIPVKGMNMYGHLRGWVRDQLLHEFQIATEEAIRNAF